ncbi:MAG: hypothetical protein CW691_10655, partial [Candidatus Bathyarchaeum sp.]
MSNKKSLKEKQKERQMKQQRSDEARRKRKATEAKDNPRKWASKKALLAISLIIIVVGAVFVWQ